MRMKEKMTDYEINIINSYLKGTRCFKSQTTRIERYGVTSMMIHLINEACGIHSDGIAVGTLDIGGYKREIKRREKYWKHVHNGETVDTRRGYDKYRKPKEKTK